MTIKLLIKCFEDKNLMIIRINLKQQTRNSSDERKTHPAATNEEK